MHQVCLDANAIRYINKVKRGYISLNKAAMMAIELVEEKDVAWKRIYMLCRSPLKYETRCKVGEVVWAFLKRLEGILRDMGIRAKKSVLMHMILAAAYEDETVIMSANMNAYKAKPSELDERVQKAADKINQNMPDIVFLQEFKPGEGNYRVIDLLERLKMDYDVFYPYDYNENEEFDFCMCIALVERRMSQDARLLKTNVFSGIDGDSKLRNNMIKIGDKIFINAWMFQTLGVSGERLKVAKEMWDDILKIAGNMSLDKKEFYLMGDLNAYKGVEFGENIDKLEEKLVNTKLLSEVRRTTRGNRVLDYSYVNKSAAQANDVITTVVDMKGISDHSCLLTRIKTKK